MAKTYRTAKGSIINMEELRQANEEKVAAGNAGLNARGDRLGPGGSIAERVAQRARQTAQSQPRQVTSVKPPISQTITPEEAAIPLAEQKQKADEARKASAKPVEVVDQDGDITVAESTRKSGTRKGQQRKEDGDDAPQTPQG